MTKQQIEEFEAITRPVIAWLNANCHPHATVVIECDKASMHMAECGYTVRERCPHCHWMLSDACCVQGRALLASRNTARAVAGG